MPFTFLHAADVHLGYQQYGLSQRYDDFSEALEWIVHTALEERVAFLLLAGDLFEKRSLDPQTLLIAVREFERLREAGIPVVAIEGNHERTYGDNLSWMEYLNHSGLLYLLDCPRQGGGWRPLPWHATERTGGYVDVAGARIYGLRYRGAETGTVLSAIGDAIAADPPPDGLFSIFLAHTSVENYYDRGHSFARQQDLSALRRSVDYLALGHVHVPYRGSLGDGEWLFNPGSPETWSSEEWQFGNKGALLVSVDTTQKPSFSAVARDYPNRRPFIRIVQELDACPSPARLMELLELKIRREPAPPSGLRQGRDGMPMRESLGSDSRPQKAPVVEIILTGVARFSRAEIDKEAIEQLARRHLDALVVRIRSSLQEALASSAIDGDQQPRDVLERLVFENLIASDDRFAAAASDNTQIAMALKQMVLDGVPNSDIAVEVGRRIRMQRNQAAGDLPTAEPSEYRVDPHGGENQESAASQEGGPAGRDDTRPLTGHAPHANAEQDTLFGPASADSETAPPLD